MGTTIRSGYSIVLVAAILLLALFTAVAHLFLGFQLLSFGGGSFGVLFVLNGLGYIGLTVLLYLPVRALERYRGAIRYVLIAYTALTVALWIPLGDRDTLAYLDKLAEVALIVLLAAEGRIARR